MLQFQAFITFVVGACGVIIAVGGAVAIIARLWAWIRKPTVDNSQTISEFEKYLASDKRRIESLEQDQEELKADVYENGAWKGRKTLCSW